MIAFLKARTVQLVLEPKLKALKLYDKQVLKRRPLVKKKAYLH